MHGPRSRFFYKEINLILFTKDNYSQATFDRSTILSPWSDISSMQGVPFGVISPPSPTIFRTAWQTTPVPLCDNVSTEPK